MWDQVRKHRGRQYSLEDVVPLNIDSNRTVTALKASASLSAMLMVLASPAIANPTGGAVSTGSASISTSSKTTTIDQTSEDVVIDWSSFNVGSGQTTNFEQPNAQAIAVNRIGGNDPSRVMGTLDANGRIVLINGNGILFGKGSSVNVGALVATSTDGSDSDVLAGKFTQAGKQGAGVINRGNISASNGTIALVAPNVTNHGMIVAKLGAVSLGAANAFTVDFKGDGLVSFATQGDVNGRAAAVNRGKLIGQTVTMTAHVAEGLATGVVNTSGLIQATGAHEQGGTVVLDAGDGSLRTSGTIDAAGKTGGGSIETSGNSVSIAGNINAGKGGSWTVDPVDLTVDSTAATTIDDALADRTNVTLQTTATGASGPGTQSSGPGDIVIDSALTWRTTSTLTLDSYHSVTVDAPIDVTGSGTLAITTNNGSSGGLFSFGTGVDVRFSKLTAGLSINGESYTLVDNIATLAGDIATNSSGYYALAKGFSAASDGTFAAAPIQTEFGGVFEGLGNKIIDLTIDDSSTNDSVGLFAENAGAINDLNLAGIDIQSTTQYVEGFNPQGSVGGLVGLNSWGGTLTGDSVTGKITVTGTGSYAGGLAGASYSAISDSSADVVLKAEYTPPANPDSPSGYYLGELVGYANTNRAQSIATITDSSASGEIVAETDANAGGLVGETNNAVIDSYASGPVSGKNYVTLGGLVGSLSDDPNLPSVGSIDGSYATGSVSGRREASVGGLVGSAVGASTEDPVTIENSYATGGVTGDNRAFAGGLIGSAYETSTTDSYATGSVTGESSALVGGLVGYNNTSTVNEAYATGAVLGGYRADVGGLAGEDTDGSIANSFATGNVSGGERSDTGGLVGDFFANTANAIQYVYSTGAVSGGSGSDGGGLVGYVSPDGISSSIEDAYWDTTTSGITNASQGVGNESNFPGVVGMTTTQFQSELPNGFDPSVWGENSAINGGLPYLLALPPG
jgi:filamentous hemagglutinin family protein